MTIRELPHNEHLLILGKCDGQNIAPAFDEFTSGYKEKENTTVNQIVTKTHCTSALFRDRPNVQHNSQTTDFQAVHPLLLRKEYRVIRQSSQDISLKKTRPSHRFAAGPSL